VSAVRRERLLVFRDAPLQFERERRGLPPALSLHGEHAEEEDSGAQDEDAKRPDPGGLPSSGRLRTVHLGRPSIVTPVPPPSNAIAPFVYGVVWLSASVIEAMVVVCVDERPDGSVVVTVSTADP
jgi:hypothetical protein